MKTTHKRSLLALVLALVLALSLTSCGQPTPPDDPEPVDPDPAPPVVAQNEGLDEFRNSLVPSDAIAGIISMGYHEGEPLDEAFWADDALQTYWLEWPFLLEIPAERYASADGNQVFAIVPADPAAKVTVTAWDANTETAGDVLYESDQGDAFFVRGNVSDIMPNLSVTIEDSRGNILSEYHPFISMKDGKVSVGDTSDLVIIDKTRYPDDPDQPTKVTFDLYYPDDLLDMQVERVTAENADAGLIIMLLTEKHVLPDTVSVNSFHQDADVLYLDLNAAFQDYLDTLPGAQAEAILYSIANSTLAALGGTAVDITSDTVSVSVDGTSYDVPFGFTNFD